MNVREEIKVKIYEFVKEKQIFPLEMSPVSLNFQENALFQGAFTDEMVDSFIYDLVDDEGVLVEFLGEELFNSKEFKKYRDIILGLKSKI